MLPLIFFAAAVTCGEATADVVFLVDSSLSVCNSTTNCSNWQSILNFMITLVNGWNIGSNGIQVGLIRYSTTPSDIFYLNTYTDKTQLINVIRGLEYVPASVQTGNMRAALMGSRTNQYVSSQGLRFGVQKIEVVLTNGGLGEQDLLTACMEANFHKNLGIVMYSVGLSSRVADVDLQCFSSQPKVRDFSYYTSTGGSGLEDIANTLNPPLCNSARTDCSRKVMDLVFILDSSNNVNADGPGGWSNILNFIANVINGLSIGSDRTLVSVATFSATAGVPIRLSYTLDKNRLISAVRNLTFLGGDANIFGALNIVRTQVFNESNGDRATVRKVALLVTTSSSLNNSVAVLDEVDRIHAAGVKTFAIGVTPRIDLAQLVNISSPPRLQYHQWWYASNLNAALDEVLNSLQPELCSPDYGKVQSEKVSACLVEGIVYMQV